MEQRPTARPPPPARPPAVLEPAPGTAQCNSDLLRAFSPFVDRENARENDGGDPPLRWTLSAAPLLRALRNAPPGLLHWDPHVAVYMPSWTQPWGAPLLSVICLRV